MCHFGKSASDLSMVASDCNGVCYLYDLCVTYFVGNLLNDLTLIWLLVSGKFFFEISFAIDWHRKLLICFLTQNKILPILLCALLQSIYLIPFTFHFLILRFSFLFLLVLTFDWIPFLLEWLITMLFPFLMSYWLMN